ncbi:MAG: TetR/AcrR family transcriptional regulator [Oscillospiraceae bacterium]
MSPVFKIEEREEIHTHLLQTGIALIKQKGIRRMTVDEITARVGIGKGTFYHFYPSKEEYAHSVILYSKNALKQAINTAQQQYGGLTRAAVEELLHSFSFIEDNNFLGALSQEDALWLRKKLPDKYRADTPEEEEIIGALMQHMVGLRPGASPYVAANMMKIMGFAAENRAYLHQNVLPQTFALLCTQLCDYLFTE